MASPKFEMRLTDERRARWQAAAVAAGAPTLAAWITGVCDDIAEPSLNGGIKDDMVRLRVAGETREAWRAAADERGMKLSAFIRDAVNAEVHSGPISLTGVVAPLEAKRPTGPPPKPADAAQSVLTPKEQRKRGKAKPAKPSGDVDLKDTSQELCPHRIPMAAYCPRCESR